METLNIKAEARRFGSDRGLITISDDFDEPLELLPSPLVDRLLEKAKELTNVSAEIDEIIAKIEKERQGDRDLQEPVGAGSPTISGNN